MRGADRVAGAGLLALGIAFSAGALKKVTSTKKWQEDYIKGNLLTPTAWTGEEANKYLDSITGDYESALTALGGLKK